MGSADSLSTAKFLANRVKRHLVFHQIAFLTLCHREEFFVAGTQECCVQARISDLEVDDEWLDLDLSHVDVVDLDNDLIVANSLHVICSELESPRQLVKFDFSFKAVES